jgi:ABC-type Fe3+-siderophore transport system permease subunit
LNRAWLAAGVASEALLAAGIFFYIITFNTLISEQTVCVQTPTGSSCKVSDVIGALPAAGIVLLLVSFVCLAATLKLAWGATAEAGRNPPPRS